MIRVHRIFLDMDGVLCDWTSSALAVYGTTLAEAKKKWKPGHYDIETGLGVSKTQMVKTISKLGKSFWTTIQPYPWAMELWNTCANIAPTTILTDPGRFGHAAEGKIEWLKDFFPVKKGRTFEDFILTPTKEVCAGPGKLLVDDKDKKVSAFRANGGQAVLFPRYWNRLHRMEDQAAELVMRQLKESVKFEYLMPSKEDME